MTGHSPIFPRRGGAATFAVEASCDARAPTLLVYVEQRDDSDEFWTVAASFPDIIASGVSTLNVVGPKELTRVSWKWSASLAENVARLLVCEPRWRPGPPRLGDKGTSTPNNM